MLKKTSLHKCSHTAGSKKGSTQCPIHTNVERVSHVCRSCNVTGRSCENIDEHKSKNNCGDYTQGKYIHVKKDERIKISKYSQDLASGDHTDKTNKVQKIFGDTHELSCKINKESLNQKRTETDVMIQYRNEYYDDSNSITNSSLCSLLKNNLLKTDKTDIKHHAQNTKATHRPVFCPVSNCAKLVAIDSIMSHFYFDHSRIPRTTLIIAEPHFVFVKSSSISSETECIAMLLIKIRSSSSQISQNSDCVSYVNSLNQNNKLLLLMAARLRTSTIKLAKYDDTKHVLKKNSYTQTNKMDFNKYIEINKQPVKVFGAESKLNTDKSEYYDNEDIVLLWLCKLDEEEKTYTIIMTREDHKLSYGYTGDAIHIKNKQDPLSIYGRPECLIVRGKAINTILDNENNIKIIVNCID